MSQSSRLDVESGLTDYSDTKIHTLFDLLATVISSLLLISSIVVIYYASSTQARLGIAAAFTFVFSFCLALISQGKRIEIFAATIAFAAVQVVFIGTTGERAGV